MFTTGDKFPIDKNLGKSNVELKQLESLIGSELREKGYYYIKYNFHKENIGLSWHKPEFIKSFLGEPFQNRVKHILTFEQTKFMTQSIHIYQKHT